VLSWIDRYGADSSSRKSALSALYLAAGRLLSEPSMTTAPSVVQTRHRHVRPRFFNTNSKTGNWSRHRDRALRSAFKGAPEMKKITTQLVGGNGRLVGENAIAFPCSEARNFHFGAGLQGSYGPRRKAARSRRTGCPAPRGREGPGFYGVEPIKFEKHEYFQFHMAVRN
jgi:hypothetical protein